jgi:hypothetical protein
MPITIGLVGCCKPKLVHAAPARDLYLSHLFRLSLEVASRCCDVVYVISAEHALVELDAVIAPYDKTMADLAKEWRPIWGSRVWGALVARHPKGARRVVIYAGKEYAEPILRAGHRHPAIDAFEQPLRGMQIGERLRWLNGRLTSLDSK